MPESIRESLNETLIEPEALEREVSAATRKLRMLRTLVCGGRYERAARATGAKVVAGVDEVGRGALFGPVVAAAVILPEGCRIPGLRDSKQLIAEERERLARIVERKALAIAIEEVDAETIDRINIYQATRMAMTAAVCRLAVAPGPPAGGCHASRLCVLANQHHLWRLVEHLDCRGFGGCQGVPRWPHVPTGP